MAGSVQTGAPGTPSTETRAYSGQPWPLPSVTLPETVWFGTAVRAKFFVSAAPSVTSTDEAAADL